MSDRPGMTVSPQISYGEDGQEYVTGFDVDDGYGRMEAIEDFNQSQDEYVLYDANGNAVHHRYWLTDEQEEQQLQSEFDEPLHQRDFYTPEISEADTEYIFEVAGGQEGYEQALSWAYQVLPENLIEAYEECVATGDVENISILTEKIVEMYYENGQTEVTDIPTEDQYETEEDQSEIVSEVFDYVGGEENYQSLISWAQESWDQDKIETYDQVMDSGDPDDIATALQYLISQYELFNWWTLTFQTTVWLMH